MLLTEKGIRTKAARAMAWNFQNLEIGTEKISVWRFFDQKSGFTGSISSWKPKLRENSRSEIIGAVGCAFLALAAIAR